MSTLNKTQRTFVVLGLVGLAAALSTEASAFGGRGGGGHGGGGHGGGARMSGGFSGPRASFRAPRMSVSAPRMSFTPRVTFNGPRIGPHFGGIGQFHPQGQMGGQFQRPLGPFGNFNRPPLGQAGKMNPTQGQVLSSKCQIAKCNIMVPATANHGTVMCFRAPCNMTGKLNPGPFLPPNKQDGKPQVFCIRAPCNVTVPKQTQQPVVMCIRAPCNVPRPHNPNDPLLHPAKNPCAFGRCQGPFGPRPIFPPQPYYPSQQAYYPSQPSYAPSYQPSGYSASAPAASTPPAQAPAAVQQPTTVSVVFQPTATSNDITSFIKAYNVTVSNGPDASGVYRLQISAGPVPQDQLNQIVQSMQGQTNIVSQVGA